MNIELCHMWYHQCEDLLLQKKHEVPDLLSAVQMLGTLNSHGWCSHWMESSLLL